MVVTAASCRSLRGATFASRRSFATRASPSPPRDDAGARRGCLPPANRCGACRLSRRRNRCRSSAAVRARLVIQVLDVGHDQHRQRRLVRRAEDPFLRFGRRLRQFGRGRDDMNDAIAARFQFGEQEGSAARGPFGWMSCSSRMPLPLASRRSIARRMMPSGLMRFQSCAITSVLQTIKPTDCR